MTEYNEAADGGKCIKEEQKLKRKELSEETIRTLFTKIYNDNKKFIRALGRE